MALHQTFELYLHRAGEAPVFEALTCADEVELMAAMRERLRDPDLVSVEAYRLGEHVTTLAR